MTLAKELLRLLEQGEEIVGFKVGDQIRIKAGVSPEEIGFPLDDPHAMFTVTDATPSATGLIMIQKQGEDFDYKVRPDQIEIAGL